MTVYIGNTEFVAQLQRERDEAIKENSKLRKLVLEILNNTLAPDQEYKDWLSQEYTDEVTRIVDQLKG